MQSTCGVKGIVKEMFKNDQVIIGVYRCGQHKQIEIFKRDAIDLTEEQKQTFRDACNNGFEKKYTRTHLPLNYFAEPIPFTVFSGTKIYSFPTYDVVPNAVNVGNYTHLDILNIDVASMFDRVDARTVVVLRFDRPSHTKFPLVRQLCSPIGPAIVYSDKSGVQFEFFCAGAILVNDDLSDFLFDVCEYPTSIDTYREIRMDEEEHFQYHLYSRALCLHKQTITAR